MKNLRILLLIGVCVSLCLSVKVKAQSTPIKAVSTTDQLYNGFVVPPEEAKPRTWWHWVGSNITKEGITKDLEWMKRSGIGGFMLFDVSNGSGQNVDKKLVVFTPEWFDALKHAASEADRLGLEMTMHASAGWSETGGPWVKPEEAVKKVVWSEIQIAGPRKYSEQLPQPPSVNGPIRDLKSSRGATQGQTNPDPTLYADSKVLAYRTPVTESQMRDFNPKITSSSGAIDASALMDDLLTTQITLAVPTIENSSWIQYEFDKPYTTRTFSLALASSASYGSASMRPGSLKISNDGINYHTIATLPGPQHDIRALTVRTFSFPLTTARFFRIEFIPGSGITTVGGPDDPGRNSTTAPGKTFNVLEAKLIVGRTKLILLQCLILRPLPHRLLPLKQLFHQEGLLISHL
jgi:hypothetical protein